VSAWIGEAAGVCYFGELIALGMKERGSVGAPVDGGVRDVRWIGEHTFPVYARYRTPVQSIGRWRATGWQTPVFLGGATTATVVVRPGDFVLCDEDGGVAVAADHSSRCWRNQSASRAMRFVSVRAGERSLVAASPRQIRPRLTGTVFKISARGARRDCQHPSFDKSLLMRSSNLRRMYARHLASPERSLLRFLRQITTWLDGPHDTLLDVCATESPASRPFRVAQFTSRLAFLISGASESH
jgi:hypothetical protein